MGWQGGSSPDEDDERGIGDSGFDLPPHATLPMERLVRRFRRIRERSGEKEARFMLQCRLLLCSITDEQHPLDNIASTLTAAYHLEGPRDFSLETDIAVLNDALMLFGIDVFANLDYDTWVLFVLSERMHTNSWTNSMFVGLNTFL